MRLTGGEPLLRRDLPDLIEMLAARPAIRDLALTTNGVLLANQAAALRAAGLHRLTVSLDTLDRDRFQALARFDELPAVLAGLDAAARAGFASLKIDTVVVRGRNETNSRPAGVRKDGSTRKSGSSSMDVGRTHWSMDAVLSRRDIRRACRRLRDD